MAKGTYVADIISPQTPPSKILSQWALDAQARGVSDVLLNLHSLVGGGALDATTQLLLLCLGVVLPCLRVRAASG